VALCPYVAGFHVADPGERTDKLRESFAVSGNFVVAPTAPLTIYLEQELGSAASPMKEQPD
jgi:hypothetical protein